tara:strand:+ start:520 stop:1203 length:684 start_codon:yes stop_codon:yes gene_type:complete
MEKRFHILVVDDDKRIRDLLTRYLSENGFWVTSTASSAEARKQLNNFIYDLIVLDVMMPGESDISLAQSLKKVSSVPILLLTAMAESDDRIAGFEIGVDDYLTKPFEPKELVFRIKNILKRNVSSQNKARREIKFGQYCFDINKETLNIDGKNVYLTTSEINLLKYLANHSGKPVSREELSQKGILPKNARSIDVKIARLRQKIEVSPKKPIYLQTIRNKGYILRTD